VKQDSRGRVSALQESSKATCGQCTSITSWKAYSKSAICPDQNTVLISLQCHEYFTDHVIFVDVSLNGYVGLNRLDISLSIYL
jgi:hypothetical protein